MLHRSAKSAPGKWACSNPQIGKRSGFLHRRRAIQRSTTIISRPVPMCAGRFRSAKVLSGRQLSSPHAGCMSCISMVRRLETPCSRRAGPITTSGYSIRRTISRLDCIRVRIRLERSLGMAGTAAMSGLPAIEICMALVQRSDFKLILISRMAHIRSLGPMRHGAVELAQLSIRICCRAKPMMPVLC